MGKKRRHKKLTKCPEPFNSLIDIAGAFALDYYYYKKRQKEKGNRQRPDPYAITGMAVGSGMVRNTEDLIQLGGILGAAGAFDEDDINDSFDWRMLVDKEDRKIVNPQYYDSLVDYTKAVVDKKNKNAMHVNSVKKQTVQSSQSGHVYHNSRSQTKEIHIYCKVSLLHNGKTEVFKTKKDNISVGNIVTVIYGDNLEPQQGVVVSVEKIDAACDERNYEMIPTIE